MAAIMSTAASKTLFRNAHNVPLKCFIQFDTSSELVTEVKNLLEVSTLFSNPTLVVLFLDHFG